MEIEGVHKDKAADSIFNNIASIQELSGCVKRERESSSSSKEKEKKIFINVLFWSNYKLMYLKRLQ